MCKNKFSQFHLSDGNFNGAILNKTESTTIFGNLADILALHEQVLADLQVRVDEISIGKKSLIGECLLKYTDAIREKYRLYIGFMDQSKREREYQKGSNSRKFILKILDPFLLNRSQDEVVVRRWLDVAFFVAVQCLESHNFSKAF